MGTFRRTGRLSASVGKRGAGAALLGILAVALLAGCGEVGLGPGEKSGSASVLVTRDFGRSDVGEFEVEGVGPSTTVIRALESGLPVETSYGGGFVEAIDGFGSGPGDGTLDWFYFVDGIEAEVGAADFTLASGDQVWWDLREWGTSMYVGSVVGSYPAPLAGGYRGARWPVSLACLSSGPTCDLVRGELEDDGIEVSPGRSGEEGVEVVVGEWRRIADRLPELGGPPSGSGVFARFAGRKAHLQLLDAGGAVVIEERRRAGLIASVGGSGEPPTWVVTGTDPAGVQAAASLLEPDRLARSYAVAAVDGEAVRLPTEPGAPAG